MGEILTFENRHIRSVLLNGVRWFVVADVCQALGLAPNNRSYAHHVHKLDLDEVSSMSDIELSVPGKGTTRAKLVSRPGVYKLIQASNKPEATRFDRWVRHTVLEAVHNDGAYVLGEEKVATGEMSEDEFVLTS